MTHAYEGHHLSLGIFEEISICEVLDDRFHSKCMELCRLAEVSSFMKTCKSFIQQELFTLASKVENISLISRIEARGVLSF